MEEMHRELIQVRAWMRCLSEDLKVLRIELGIQEKRMERLIQYKEGLEREMVPVKVIPPNENRRTSNGRRLSDKSLNLNNLHDLGEAEALELMKLLMDKFPEVKEGSEEEEVSND